MKPAKSEKGSCPRKEVTGSRRVLGVGTGWYVPEGREGEQTIENTGKALLNVKRIRVQ